MLAQHQFASKRPLHVVAATARIVRPSPAKSRKDIINIATDHYDPGLIAIDRDIIQYFDYASIMPPASELPVMPAGCDTQEKIQFAITYAAQLFRLWRRKEDGTVSTMFNGQNASEAIAERLLRGWPIHRPDHVFNGFSYPTARNAVLQETIAGSDCLKSIANHLLKTGISTGFTVADAAFLALAFPLSFRDMYLAKAQLALRLVAQVIAGALGQPVKTELTSRADNELPRVLRALGILRYSKELACKVDGGIALAKGDPAENVIRSSTILAMEEMAQTSGLSVELIDSALRTNSDIAGTAKFHLIDTNEY